MLIWTLICFGFGLITGNFILAFALWVAGIIVYGALVGFVAVLGYICKGYIYLFVDNTVFKKIDTSDVSLAKIANSRFKDLARIQAEFDRLRGLTEEQKYAEVKSAY